MNYNATPFGDQQPSGLFTNERHRKAAVIDIESAATEESAGIFSIGIAVVDLTALEITDTFFRAIRQDSWPEHQSIYSSGTMQWWEKQSAEARAQVFNNDEACNLEDSLIDMQTFLNRAGCTDFFGNGPEFDCTILNHALTGYGLPALHNPCLNKHRGFACQQSIQTVVMLGRVIFGDCIKYREFRGIKHHALDDAIHEAEILTDTLKRFVDLKQDALSLCASS